MRKFIVTSEIYFQPTGIAVIQSIISDRETLEIGKQGAKLQTIRHVRESAGVYISRLSVMKAHELDTDEVVAFTAGIVKAGNVNCEPVPLGDALGTIKYLATVVVTIDTANLTNQINAWLNRNSRDRSNIVAPNEDLQNLAAQQAKRIRKLERTITASTDKATVRQEISRPDNDTKIIQKTVDSNQAYFNGDYSTVAKNYSDVLFI